MASHLQLTAEAKSITLHQLRAYEKQRLMQARWLLVFCDLDPVSLDLLSLHGASAESPDAQV